MNRNPNVFFVTGVLNGCQWYRIRQPALKMMEKRLLNTAVNIDMSNEDLEIALTRSDILVTQNFGASFLEYAENDRGAQKLVFDYDDNVFDVSPYNPAYEHHGLREVDVTLADGKEIHLWKDGVNRFDIKRNQKNHDNFVRVLKTADLVTTPSQELAWLFKENGAKKVKVIKNSVDPATWYPVKMERDNFIRIGYQGGWSHYEDWLEVSEAISAVMNTYKNTLLVVMGQHYSGTVKGLPEDRVIVEPWASVDVYPWKFKTLGIDIGVAPLKSSDFNKCKSEIKWEEYSMLEIPTIASNTLPYNAAIDDGQTGFVASDHRDWVNCLSNLIESESMRREIGKSAREAVLKKYDINDRVFDYMRNFQELVGAGLVTV